MIEDICGIQVKGRYAFARRFADLVVLVLYATHDL